MNRLGIGLIGMRERLHLVSGEISIESEPGCGTTILACVPLSSKLNVATAGDTRLILDHGKIAEGSKSNAGHVVTFLAERID